VPRHPLKLTKTTGSMWKSCNRLCLAPTAGGGAASRWLCSPVPAKHKPSLFPVGRHHARRDPHPASAPGRGPPSLSSSGSTSGLPSTQEAVLCAAPGRRRGSARGCGPEAMASNMRMDGLHRVGLFTATQFPLKLCRGAWHEHR
jgi:hypothetical protein